MIALTSVPFNTWIVGWTSIPFGLLFTIRSSSSLILSSGIFSGYIACFSSSGSTHETISPFKHIWFGFLGCLSIVIYPALIHFWIVCLEVSETCDIITLSNLFPASSMLIVCMFTLLFHPFYVFHL